MKVNDGAGLVSCTDFAHLKQRHPPNVFLLVDFAITVHGSVQAF